MAEYSQGLTIQAIADRHGLHVTTVSRHLHSRQVTIRIQTRHLTQAQLTYATHRLAAGASMRALAAELGFNPHTLKAALGRPPAR